MSSTGSQGYSINFKSMIKDFESMAVTNQKKYKRKVLTDVQTVLLRYIRALAPRNTGDYAKSWKRGKIIQDVAIVKTTAGFLYEMLEYTGAKPQLRQRSPGQKPYVFTNAQGETIFTFKINWPGFDNIPHVRPAMRKLEGVLPLIMIAHLDILSPLYEKQARKARGQIKKLTRKKARKKPSNRTLFELNA